MEFLIIIGFWVGVWLISVIVSKVSEAIRKKRERIRDHVAEEVLSGLNIQSVIDGYRSKLEDIRYKRVDLTQETLERFNQWQYGRDSVLLGQCPDCKDSYLLVRKGAYGKFLACSKYPKCKYTKNIKKAREEYRKSINEQIIKDIQKAYS